MREEHPIDNHFREALLGNEVEPPPSVWEGVKNGRRRRRGLVFWSRRRGLAVITLFVALGAGAYWAVRHDRTEDLPSVTLSNPSTAAEKTFPATQSTEQRPAIESTSEATITAPISPPPVVADESIAGNPIVISKRSSEQRPPVDEEHNRISVPPIAIADAAASSGIDLSLSTEATTDIRTALSALSVGPIDRLEPLRSHLRVQAPTFTPETRMVPVYVLPPGEWWLAAQLGWYDVRRQWKGSDTQLSDALNASETWTSTIGVGLVVGRTWRSGWGFSVGAEHEQSEQAFRYVDRVTQVDQEIITSIVTLNTEVIASTSDTVVTQVLDERVSEGMDRRSVVRVPLEGHWRASWRRWAFGVSVGVAGEFTHVTSGAILVRNEPDGRITTAATGSDELRARYPVVLLGTVSAEVGYVLHERWNLWASPAYMRTLGAFEQGSAVYSEPERFGLRLRLSYTFNGTRDR